MMRSITIVLLIIIAALLLTGCKLMTKMGLHQPSPAPGSTAHSPVADETFLPPQQVTLAENVPSWTIWEKPPSLTDPADVISAEINNVRSATMLVALMPPLLDPLARQEVLLHATLYRAACEGFDRGAGGNQRHFLLQPFEDWVLERLEMSRREFRLRVLAGLANMNCPIAWLNSDSNPSSEPTRRDLFPGTPFLATRLQISIINRDPEQAIVIAEIADRTFAASSSRRIVRGTWDGLAWRITTTGARSQW